MKTEDSKANLYYEFFATQIANKNNAGYCNTYADDGSRELCVTMQAAVPNY
jgi:hypothetical protein